MESIFEKTYKNYLERLREVSFESVAQDLGAEIEGNVLQIALFKEVYNVSHEKIVDSSGKKPSHEICVILSKYILSCPDKLPNTNRWVSFRDFKDSGPLINYFTHDVENAIVSYFSEKLDDLIKAGNLLGGYQPVLDVNYDCSLQFDALPRIPVILLYNDRDDEFSAKCSVLFDSRTERYLDAECIAMLGRQLFDRLKNTLKRSSDNLLACDIPVNCYTENNY